MLLVDHVLKSYGPNPVLRNVSFEVDDGTMAALVGPNGAGKSTLLHILVGLLQADAGEVTLDGATHDSAQYRSQIGFCPDDLPQAELLTGREYLDMVIGIRRLKIPRTALTQMVEGMHLDTAIDRLIAEYSHGMKRKLQIIAALLHSPRLLILDEPFRGLDPESSAILKSLLRLYTSRGNTVLISTHDLLVADQMADDVLLLHAGSLSTRADLTTSTDSNESLEDSFLRVTGLGAQSEIAAENFFGGLDQLTPTR